MAGADCAPNSVEYWDDFYDDRRSPRLTARLLHAGMLCCRSAYDTLYGYEEPASQFLPHDVLLASMVQPPKLLHVQDSRDLLETILGKSVGLLPRCCSGRCVMLCLSRICERCCCP